MPSLAAEGQGPRVQAGSNYRKSLIPTSPKLPGFHQYAQFPLNKYWARVHGRVAGYHSPRGRQRRPRQAQEGPVSKSVPAAAVCVEPYISVEQSGRKATDKY